MKRNLGYIVAVLFNAVYFYSYFIATGKLDIWNNPNEFTRNMAGMILFLGTFISILSQLISNYVPNSQKSDEVELPAEKFNA